MTQSQPADPSAEIARLGALAVDFHRRLELDPGAIYPAHADCLWQLGTLRIAQGEVDQGLLDVAGSVELYRALAQAQPESYAVQLASLLNSQSNLLAEASHLEEALAVGNEAVSHARVAMDLRPDQTRFVLVSSLINLAGLKMRGGDTAGTVNELAHAVEVFRDGGTTGQQFLGSMVEALHRAAMAFTEIGMWGEAIDTRRLLLGLFPENPPAAVVHLLILTLQQASVALSGAGRTEDALVCANEAATLARALYEADPTAHRLALAQALGNLAGRNHDLGRLKEGLDLALEAVDLFHEVVGSDPVHAVPSLILTLETLAGILTSLGLSEQAATVDEQRRQLQQTLDLMAPRQA
ncbi:MAG: tetratricopeptide repeat protein [Magnetospirillum sp.]|nr:tetratricopeptide repeat protein [Magnetospirillum sp.]